MNDKVGLLNKDEEKFYGRLIADEINVDGILGTVVKLAAPMLIRIPDDKWGDDIPEPWQGYLEKLTTMVYVAFQDKVITLEEETQIVEYCTLVMNAEIDLPLLGEEDEAVTFLFLWKYIASLLRKLVRKVKEKK